LYVIEYIYVVFHVGCKIMLVKTDAALGHRGSNLSYKGTSASEVVPQLGIESHEKIFLKIRTYIIYDSFGVLLLLKHLL
jgi:hypothetical protein